MMISKYNALTSSMRSFGAINVLTQNICTVVGAQRTFKLCELTC